MRRLFIPVALGAGLLGACAPVEEPARQVGPVLDEAAVLARSAQVGAGFQAQLQAQLLAAMQDGGPLKALDVCKEAAPAIAAQASAQSGARVTRIAERHRNPDAGIPAEAAPHYAALKEAPLANGAPRAVLWRSADGARVNVLRAIPMQEQPCAACHGTTLAPQVAQRITALYPGDTATGFRPGDLRGALLVSWPIESFAAQ